MKTVRKIMGKDKRVNIFMINAKLYLRLLTGFVPLQPIAISTNAKLYRGL
jgi:hypothetical protein